MADIQIYLKPRPISPVYGHSDYLPFKWNSYRHYGPFFDDYGMVPRDATEVHIIQSPALSTLYTVFIPSLNVEVPDPNKSGTSAWPALLELAKSKVAFSIDSRMECENHIVRLSQGDRAPAPPPRNMRAPDFSSEWYKIVFSTISRGDVELRDESRDTELELFVWVAMHQIIDDRTDIWRHFREEMLKLTDPIAPARLPSGHAYNPGIFNFLGRKALTAVSTFASTFLAGAPVDDTDPLPLSPSPNNGSLANDSMPSSYTGDIDDDTNLSALNRSVEPYRRRKRIIVSESVDL
ncbi:uncharacterized protein EV420DRAFT_382305 [Desarmillaria tabescens]|uniref:Uncharacterized protein n=1 Tax=Armillaria tabescens TaxID=1929756 RepID=A0AA39KBY2_ARMTA|nr:uncharacterized protein EV420DRAFT_382305 [Desarmillaria tabescens]KAK0458157.1 hypothetical protein EV420DRAFT_382305 [Desarmillaria tabescens]